MFNLIVSFQLMFHLRVYQPAVVQWDVQQVKHNALWRVLKVGDSCEANIDVQAC